MKERKGLPNLFWQTFFSLKNEQERVPCKKEATSVPFPEQMWLHVIFFLKLTNRIRFNQFEEIVSFVVN